MDTLTVPQLEDRKAADEIINGLIQLLLKLNDFGIRTEMTVNAVSTNHTIFKNAETDKINIAMKDQGTSRRTLQGLLIDIFP